LPLSLNTSERMLGLKWKLRRGAEVKGEGHEGGKPGAGAIGWGEFEWPEGRGGHVS